MKNQSYIQRRRKDFIITQNIVLTLTGMSVEDFTNAQYERGLQYLDIVCADNPVALEELSGSKIFWQWWRNMWQLRDEEFITPQIFFLHPKIRINVWNEWHHPCFLTSARTEKGRNMEQSYAQIIGKIIKINTQKPIKK